MTTPRPAAAELAELFADLMQQLAGTPPPGDDAVHARLCDAAARAEQRGDADGASVARFLRTCGPRVVDTGAPGLLQAAIAEADTAPVTRAAEAWLASGGRVANASWLRRVGRPAVPEPSACVVAIPRVECHRHPFALHPDGRRVIAFGAAPSQLCVWDLRTGARRAALGEHASWDGCVAVMPGGREVLVSGFDRFEVLDLESGAVRARHTFGVPKRRLKIESRVVVPGGARIVTATPSDVMVWDTATGALQATLGRFKNVTWVHAHPDGRRLLVACKDRVVRVLDLDDAGGRVLCEMAGHKGGVHASSVAITPEGDRLVTVDYDATLRVFDLATGACVHSFGLAERSIALAALPDGRRVVTARAGTLEVWDLAAARCVATARAHGPWVTALRAEPDGAHLVGTVESGALRRWQLDLFEPVNPPDPPATKPAPEPTARKPATGKARAAKKSAASVVTPPPPSTLPRGWVRLLAVAPAQPWCVSTHEDLWPRVWRTDSGARHGLLVGHTGKPDLFAVADVALHPREPRAVTCGFDRTVRLWDLETCACTATLKGHTDGVTCLAWHADGRRVLSGAWDATLRLWDPESGEAVVARTEARGQDHAVFAVAAHPDGRRALAGSYDGTLRVWDLSNEPRVLAEAKTGTSGPDTILVLPDGERAIVIDDGSVVSAWRIDGLERLWTYEYSATVALLPDGAHALVRRAAGGLAVIALETGAVVREFAQDASFTDHVALLGADGARCVAISAGALRVWDVATGAPLASWRPDAEVSALVVGPEGRIAFGTRDGEAQFVDLVSR